MLPDKLRVFLWDISFGLDSEIPVCCILEYSVLRFLGARPHPKCDLKGCNFRHCRIHCHYHGPDKYTRHPEADCLLVPIKN